MSEDRLFGSRPRLVILDEIGSVPRSFVERGSFRCSVCDAVARPVGAICSLCKRVMGEDGPIDASLSSLSSCLRRRTSVEGRGGDSETFGAVLPRPASLSFAEFFLARPEFRGACPVVEELTVRVVVTAINRIKGKLEARLTGGELVELAPGICFTDGARG